MSKHYIDEEGTTIVVDAKTDISTATALELRVKKPDGGQITWTAAAYDLSHAQYVVQAGDFDQAGTYYLQLYIDSPTWAGLGETFTIEIYDRFQ